MQPGLAIHKHAPAHRGDIIEMVPAPKPLVGACEVPGSKSLSIRALLLAGFAQGVSHLSGLLHSDDVFWGQEVLTGLGIGVHGAQSTEGYLRVDGCALTPAVLQASLHLGDAGTLARFLPGLLAASHQGNYALTGSTQLERRPLAPLLAALKHMGAQLEASARGGLPLQVAAGGLTGTKVHLAGDVSSQFVSGVLMAAAASGQAFDVVLDGQLVQPAYVAMSVNYLQRFGAHIDTHRAHERWHVRASKLVGQTLHTEAEASTACYFWALAAASGGTIEVRNVGSASMQADVGLLPFLQRMGCQVTQTQTATTVMGPVQLQGGFKADLSHISDQAPTLAALAALADKPVYITGVGHIRHHESDRLAVMATSLKALGAQVNLHAAGLSVTPQPLHGADIDPHDDHRIAMSMALLGVKTAGVRINNPGCVAKTCPKYFEMLANLGLNSHCLAQSDA